MEFVQKRMQLEFQSHSPIPLSELIAVMLPTEKKNSSFALNFFPLSNGSFRKHFKITQQKKIILKHLETFTSGWGYVFFDTMETHFEKEDSALSWSQVFLFYS